VLDGIRELSTVFTHRVSIDIEGRCSRSVPEPCWRILNRRAAINEKSGVKVTQDKRRERPRTKRPSVGVCRETSFWQFSNSQQVPRSNRERSNVSYPGFITSASPEVRNFSASRQVQPICQTISFTHFARIVR
jgi:hypothetical protein